MDPRGVLVSAFLLTKLSIQFLVLMAKAKYQHRRAKSTFRRTLILQGILPETAKELAKAYPNPVSELFSLINILQHG